MMSMLANTHTRISADVVKIDETGQEIEISAKVVELAELRAQELRPGDEGYSELAEIFNWIRHAYALPIEPE